MAMRYMPQFREADFTAPLHFETWVEAKKSSVLVNQGFVISRNGEKYAEGRLESCLYDQNKNRLTRLAAVDIPDDVAIDRIAGVEPFTKLSAAIDDMEYSYTNSNDLIRRRHRIQLRQRQLMQRFLISSVILQYICI